jgi:hypothetical protein
VRAASILVDSWNLRWPWLAVTTGVFAIVDYLRLGPTAATLSRRWIILFHSIARIYAITKQKNRNAPEFFISTFCVRYRTKV